MSYFYLDKPLFIEAPREKIGESEIDKGTKIYPPTHLVNFNSLGSNNLIVNVYLEETTIGHNCQIIFSHLIQTKIGNETKISGAWLENSRIGHKVLIGPGANLKRAIIASEVRIPHHCYLADIGIDEGTNIAVGVYTCNFNGVEKERTTIGPYCFIGTGVHLLAPCKIGRESYIAERVSIKPKEIIPPHSLVVGCGKNYSIKKNRAFYLGEHTWIYTKTITSPLLMQEIRELFEEIKKKNPSFSLRQWLLNPLGQLNLKTPLHLLKEEAYYYCLTGAKALKKLLEEKLSNP